METDRNFPKGKSVLPKSVLKESVLVPSFLMYAIKTAFGAPSL